jgi:hypothetical protein
MIFGKGRGKINIIFRPKYIPLNMPPRGLEENQRYPLIIYGSVMRIGDVFHM